jgi:hypothetical protein
MDPDPGGPQNIQILRIRIQLRIRNIAWHICSFNLNKATGEASGNIQLLITKKAVNFQT